jgi:ATP-dependent Clp protease ATP-binding subunit ClpA
MCAEVETQPMKTMVMPARTRTEKTQNGDLGARLRERVVGQDEAIDAIVPYVHLYEAGLAPEGRPVGVFLLLGPTGTGKTRTVEALADAVHGSERNLLRVDCGEFQLEHEVAKLIGAPPGYLGHRETQPMVSQHRLNATTSDRSSLSIVLFDEIEKAAPSMGRLLLGVLDKATLKLGDNTTVNFERSLIFMTSNLGAREMESELTRRFGLASATSSGADADKLGRIGMGAVKRRFSPEFINRVDRMITYRPLAGEALESILDLQMEALNRHIHLRLGPAAFQLQLAAPAREFLLTRGTSAEYGARELKRAMHRHVIQPLARVVLEHRADPGATLKVDVAADGGTLTFQGKGGRLLAA